MIRFDCIKKKIIRQREENDDSNTTGVRITTRSDVAFVLDGVRQDEVEENIEHEQLDKNQLSSGDLICGSFIINENKYNINFLCAI